MLSYINTIKQQLNLRKLYTGRSKWPRGLRRDSAAAGSLGLWFRIPGHVYLSPVCVVCCQTSLRRADRSSGGVLPSVVRLSVI